MSESFSRGTSARVEKHTASYPDETIETVLSALGEYIRQTEFKRLLNQVASQQLALGFKSVALISEFPGEGKTFFVSALALAYARFLQSKVLIINTSQQPPSRMLYLESILGSHAPDQIGVDGRLKPGIIDLVSAQVDKNAISNESSDFQVGAYVRSVQDRYDIVLVDTASMRSAGKDNMDPIVVAQQVDTAVLVTSAVSAEPATMRKIQKQLLRYRLKLLGTVFNKSAV